jgi:hypothetical protein
MSKRLMPVIALFLILLLAVDAALVAQQAPPKTAASPAPAKTAATQAEVMALTNEILEQVSALRQLKILHPVKSGVKSRSEIEQVVIREFDESSKPAEIEATTKALIAFGLLPKGFRLREFMIRLLTEQVAGFYQPKTKEFFIADWNELEQQKPVIAHELTHALQDQHFNLRRFEKWPRGDSDRELAIHALIEGDATALMFDYLLKPRGLDITRLAIPLSTLNEMAAAASDKDTEKVISTAPAAIRESLLFPYSHGAGFAQEVLKKQGWDGLSRAYTDLPQSTEQILHPHKYLVREPPVKIQLAEIAPLLGAGWKRLETDINGEFGYTLILAEFIPKQQARVAAEGWGGDQYAFYEQTATGHSLLAHLSAWDTEKDAEEFFEAYAARTSKRYPDARARAGLPPTERAFETVDGETFIQRRGQSVLIIEGVPARQRARLTRLAATLWQKAAR